MQDRDTSPRVATAADARSIVATLTGAFDADPLWRWAFPDPDKRAEQFETWFGLFVERALPNGGVCVDARGGGPAVWPPPRKPDLSAEPKAKVEPFLTAEL